MKKYELEALLSTLDDSAEVSIELEGTKHDYGNWPNTESFDVHCDFGQSPRSAVLRVTAEDLKVIPGAQERIEELEQEVDDINAEAEKLKDVARLLIKQLGDDFEPITRDLEELL